MGFVRLGGSKHEGTQKKRSYNTRSPKQYPPEFWETPTSGSRGLGSMDLDLVGPKAGWKRRQAMRAVVLAWSTRSGHTNSRSR